MRWVGVWLYIALLILAFLFNLLGLMNLYPLYVTASVWFAALFLPVYIANRKK